MTDKDTTRRPWFKFYVGDWTIKTAMLSREEKGFYIDLLACEWANGPLDPARVKSVFGDVPPAVLAKFDLVDGFLVNDRLERERAEAAESSERQAQKARLSNQSQARRRAAATTAATTAAVLAATAPEAPLRESESQSKSILMGAPVEPPRGFPSSEEAARQEAAFAGVPPEFAVTFWNQAVARGFVDHAGQPIRSFRHALKAAHAYHSDREKRNGHNRPSAAPGRVSATAQLIADQRELERVEAETKRIRDGYASHEDMADKDRAELKRLKARAAELKGKLGFAA